MKRVYLVGLFALMLSFNHVSACGGTGLPSYGGSISYTTDSTNPLKVNVTVTMFFINNEALATDSIEFNWGDASLSGLQGIYARSINPDSIAFANSLYLPQIYTHVYTGSHTYASAAPGGGCYTTFITNTYRPAGIVNIQYNDSYLVPYTIDATICVDSNNYYQSPAMPPVDVFVCTNNTFTSASQLGDVSSGDSVTFQLVTPLITAGVPVPGYQLPSQACGGNQDSSFTMDINTGVITWPVVCSDSTYDIAMLISSYSNGKLIGAVMRDQLIYALTPTTSAIIETPAIGSLSVYPNPTSSQLTITLPDNNTGQITMYDVAGREVLTSKTGNSIQQTLDISALPQGAYLLVYQNAGGKYSQKIIKE